jgi:hypothetical protein
VVDAKETKMTTIKFVKLNGNPKQREITLRVIYAQGEAQLTLPVIEPQPRGELPVVTGQRAIDALMGALEAWEKSERLIG